MASKKYWKSEAELNPNDSIVETLRQNEFPEEIPVDEFLGDKENLSASTTNRRDFLKYVGFSTAAASLAACEGPVRKSIPYVIKPEQIIPGIANYYATTIADGYDFASILIKTREGRPIKVENNKDAKTNGNSNARIQASVLSLYDSTRLQGPLANGEPAEWTAIDNSVKNKLEALKGSEKQIVLLTQTYASPSTSKLISEFKEVYGNVNHIAYDAISEDAALTAFEAKFGERALPTYDFEKAEIIVSFGADFLADWQGGGYDSGYSKGRIPKKGKMSRHIQFESNMSLTGANADKRIAIKPSEQKKALASLFGKLNNSSVNVDLSENISKAVDDVAAEIRKAGNKAVVVTGLDDVNAQAVTLSINEMLGSIAYNPSVPRYIRQGNSQAVNKLIQDMNSGKVGALIMDGVNPMYTLPNATEFSEGVAKVDLSVTFSTNWNETTEITEFTAAANHFLESWGDAELVKGHYSLIQPTIKELFDTRQFQQSLLQWMGSDLSYYDYIKETWNSGILEDASWNKALHDGVFVLESSNEGETSATNNRSGDQTMEQQSEANATVAPISSAVSSLANASADGMELVLYPKIGMGDGKQANNPWLQEFPDPISRVSWDNYVTVSRADASTLGLINENVANGGLNGSYAKLTVNGVALENVPVLIQPGQAAGTVGLSFG
ncbi:MAG: TAT-variant-translocated molybdopterin oxidoreductase, partial [Eudoraea sp.]|uniref:TAT-variant-translocated molybdopterin oxidoreductase n=1 Tax=Eudoraea sp. TaxID=1979955 RepID=UPI003C7964EE